MKDIKKLISEMTVDEKIGQLCQGTAGLFLNTESDLTGPAVKAGYNAEQFSCFGSVLNFANASEAIEMQRKHLENDRHRIPMMLMMDVIHGYRTIYPIPLGLACSFDEQTVEDCSAMAAREASAAGIHVTFTPMVDYVRDARWGRVMESGGEEPLVTGRLGQAQVRGFQGDDLKDNEHIATCVKHFACNGAGEAGREYNTVEISEHVMREYYLPAYKACLDAGAKMVMPSFNSIGGVPGTANRWLIQKVLKEEWGFDGTIISDWGAVSELIDHGVAADMKDAARLAFGNNCDIEMCTAAYAGHLKDLIEEGVLTKQQLDEAVGRILRLKDELGLFDDPFRGASSEREERVIFSAEHRLIAKKAAEESAVLLKNEGVLPFDKSVKKVAVIGAFGDNCNILGSWSCNCKGEDTVTVLAGLKAMLPDAEITCDFGAGARFEDTSTDGFADAVAAAKAADAVVLCIGEPHYYSGEGNSRTHLELPGVQAELARQVCAANANTAVLVFGGRPLALSELDDCAKAIMMMWFPGTEGGSAAAELLFGDANPSGKLTMSFPKTAGQCPIYYNRLNTGRPKNTARDAEYIPYCSNYLDCTNLPQYFFGQGLSYSKFEYGELKLSSDTLKKGGKLIASVTVTNLSDRDGKEVVQLYMHDRVASTSRPVQQLIDYKKLLIKAGETVTVEFEIGEEMLRFYDRFNEFVSEPGEFDLMVGYADHFSSKARFTLVD